ncbi:hypothetical protein LUZ63_003802 [Rhynchospora breviuscula]|uniref:Uncharacterized protein n=1 Tax=Rhynchospora breviuscula TaxID=2022672 RepID=A0A9Q0I0E4_9POAL|nr:hypothetical protein LUZ63_003802 [Rhynchospora breviuscula]
MEYPKQTSGMTPSPQPAPGNRPVAPPDALPQKQAWSTGLCGCFDDVSNCCLTCWCPCITFGQIAEIVDKGNTSCGTAGGLYFLLYCFTGCQWIYSCTYRSRMRKENNLEEAPCADCCVHFCCEAFALCQMSRELKNRGWDLSLGYRLNLEKRGGMIQLPAAIPPPPQGMIR